MSEQDQRTVHRVPFVQAARLQLGDIAVAVHVLDISLMGALVALDAPVDIAPGEVCGVELTLGPEVALDLHARVVRTAADGSRLGISWGNMDLHNATHLHRLLELNLGNPALMEQDIEAMYEALASGAR